MTITLNEREVVAQAVEKLLQPDRLQQLAEKTLLRRIECITAREACKRLSIGLRAFRALKLPVVALSEKTHRYRVADIEAELKRRTNR